MSRIKKGEEHYAARLTEREVAAIRRARGGCECCGRKPTFKMLAERFGVSAPMIHHIVSGKAWKGVQ